MIDQRYRRRVYRVVANLVGMGTICYGQGNTRYIVTANHVMKGRKTAEIVGLGTASIYKVNAAKDVCVLQIAGSYKCATFAKELPMRGRKIAAAGNIAGYTTWSEGYLGLPVGIDMLGVDDRGLTCYEFYGDVTQGYSGSGVFDTVTGEYIGMILADNNVKGYENISYFISMHEITNALK